MKILLWSPNGAGLHYGGAGTNAYRLYSSKSIPGVTITLVCANHAQTDYPVFDKIIRLHPRNSQTILNHFVYLYKARRWLVKNAGDFDIFHGIDIFDNTVKPAIWAESLGLPAVVKPASHGAGLTSVPGLKRLLRLPEKRRELLKKLSGVIAISSAIETEMESYGIHNVQAIPNGVDARRFRPGTMDERGALRQRFGWPADAVVILFVGAIASRKQPLWLVEALAADMRANPKLRLAYVGPEREAGHLQLLRKKIEAERIAEQVTLAGLQPDVELYYRAADVYCLPSRQEGMPNSVLEAMASGLPCLVTKISGSEDLVRQGINGFWVDNPASIRESIQQYVAAPSLMRSHGENGRSLVEAHYSCDAVLDAHLQLFRLIISNKKGLPAVHGTK